MALAPGTCLGKYEIISALGVGGMGEVYRARDTKLGREVAIKVLPDRVAGDPVRLARFDREAKLLASLNHPNIATLYGFDHDADKSFLAMEVVDGPTLAELFREGPMPLDRLLPIFIQLAEGLESAHKTNVIHRDLKPANIKVRIDGRVKILDFGLAKPLTAGAASLRVGKDAESSIAHETLDVAPEERALSQLPTRTQPGSLAESRLGAVVGTPGYMSPEQARGETVDAGTDAWAFGCCLYEALTGSKAWPRSGGEPDWTLLPQGIPVQLRRTVEDCFAHDASGRPRDFGAVAVLLKEVDRRGRELDQGERATDSGIERRLFDLSNDLLCVARADGTFVRVNPAFERTLGWATEELEGKPYLGFVHPDDIAATMKEYANLLDGIPTRMFRNRYRCSDGSYIALLWNSQPDYDTGFVYAVARVTV